MIRYHDRAETLREKRFFERVGRADRQYASALKKLARQVGDIIDAYAGRLPGDLDELLHLLDRYSELIEPWGKIAAQRMLADVMRRDETAWSKLGKSMGVALREEIRNAPTGELFRRLMDEQVSLIKSIPIEAGQRVHKAILEGMSGGKRYSEYVDMVQASGDVARSRAVLIARTETARSASLLTQSRATFIQSPGYYWRTSKDGDVRPSHRKMEGKFVEWSKPPRLSDGTVTHAGQIYNCRCWAEVVIPAEYLPRRRLAA